MLRDSESYQARPLSTIFGCWLTMGSQIALSAGTLGIFHVDKVPQESITRVNQLLQRNHDDWHIIWRMVGGLHNHQVHYLLTDLSLGATPEQIQVAFDTNATLSATHRDWRRKKGDHHHQGKFQQLPWVTKNSMLHIWSSSRERWPSRGGRPPLTSISFPRHLKLMTYWGDSMKVRSVLCSEDVVLASN